MRGLMTAALSGAMALFANPSGAADNTMTIAVFTKNTTNPAYSAFRLAADQIGQATGARIVHFVPMQPDNVDEQKAMVEQVLKEAKEAKIPVVLAANPLPGNFVTFVGADDFAIGYRQARYLFDHLAGKGRIVILEGTAGAPTNRERIRGYKQALTEAPGITVLASASGSYQQADGKRVMAGFLADRAEIDAVLSANDSMALGALEALKEANRTAVVIGINGILPAVKRIGSGELLATVDFNMFKIGCTATRAAVRYLRREPLPEKVMLPAEIIDRSNYKAWLVPVERRPCPEWDDVVKP